MRTRVLQALSTASGRLLAVCLLAAPHATRGGEPAAGLELRQLLPPNHDSLAATGTPILQDAVRVFVHEGAPLGVHVTEQYIAVDYRCSGVLFDRATGKPARRLTVADRWPDARPRVFGQPPPRWPRRKLVGPGVSNVRTDANVRESSKSVIVASATFAGRTWEARQPLGFLNILLCDLDRKQRSEQFGAWTPILRRLNDVSYLRPAPVPGGGDTTRYTTAEGLASNIVTHLAAADGALWAACADIYDPERKEWGPGGLCRLDAGADRWRRIDLIDGKPVRWVTLLQSIGDELWVGFREGSRIAGDKVNYGMGIYPGDYGPQAATLVLARLAGGQWRSFTRPVGPQPLPPESVPANANEPPTEKPHRIARSGGHAILFSTTRSRRLSGDWDVELDGHLTTLDLATGQWRLYDADKNLDADVLHELIVEDGEILVTSNRGVHRWDAKALAWRFLDPRCDLRNPTLSAATPVGDELWVGYANQSFGVIGLQGISRFHETTGAWTHTLPKELGTACPVRAVAALSKDDVWVLFRPRPSYSAAVEGHDYPREGRTPRPMGIGRFAGGKWTFPVELPGVPDAAAPEHRRGTPAWRIGFWGPGVQHLAATGGQLFVGGSGGLFVGPGQWTQLTAHPVLLLAASQDGKALDVECRDPDPTALETILRGQYDPASGRLTLEKVVPKNGFYDRGTLLARPRDAQWKGIWVRIPTAGPGQWAVGPLGKWGRHAVVETPAAVWIASQGELIRLDRRRLAERLGR